ncbi:hypothetical protein Tco_1472428 [Tanacetum coccineum]
MMFEIYYAFKGQTPPSSSVPTTTLALTEGLATIRGRILLILPLKNLILTLRGEKADMETEVGVEKEQPKEPEVENIMQEPVRASRRVSITIVRPMTRLAPELEMISSSLRAQLTDTILEVPIPQPTGPHLDKEEKMKKVTEEAKLLAMSKPKLIKVVHEKVLKGGIDPKILEIVKGGQQFKKI